jgi:HSP20 family molecular chaperone IbpA
MSSEPSPEEQKKLDAEAKAKQDAEQAALPYKWDQTIKDLDITVSIEPKYKGKDLDIKIARNTLKVGIKGQEPIIDVRFPHTMYPEFF